MKIEYPILLIWIIKNEIKSIIMERKNHFGSMSTIGHKEFLTKIREM